MGSVWRSQGVVLVVMKVWQMHSAAKSATIGRLYERGDGRWEVFQIVPRNVRDNKS